MKRILVTGPESTGKTELAIRLAERLGGLVVEEYARGYIEKLESPYGYEDVERIALHQAKEYDRDHPGQEWVIFDTWLIITKVWFEVVFGRVPGWIHGRIREARFDLILLCAPDIPWVPDPVRENGGAKREALFERYKKEMDGYAMVWNLVTGHGEQRLLRSEQIIREKLQHGIH